MGLRAAKVVQIRIVQKRMYSNELNVKVPADWDDGDIVAWVSCEAVGLPEDGDIPDACKERCDVLGVADVEAGFDYDATGETTTKTKKSRLSDMTDEKIALMLVSQRKGDPLYLYDIYESKRWWVKSFDSYLVNWECEDDAGQTMWFISYQLCEEEKEAQCYRAAWALARLPTS